MPADTPWGGVTEPGKNPPTAPPTPQQKEEEREREEAGFKELEAKKAERDGLDEEAEKRMEHEAPLPTQPKNAQADEEEVNNDEDPLPPRRQKEADEEEEYNSGRSKW